MLHATLRAWHNPRAWKFPDTRALVIGAQVRLDEHPLTGPHLYKIAPNRHLGVQQADDLDVLQEEGRCT